MSKIQEWVAKNLLGVDVKAITRSLPMLTQMGGANIPVTFIGENNQEYLEEGYGANDIVYSILTMAADKERMAPWDVYKIVDESSLKLYEAEMSAKMVNRKKALDYRTKAIQLFHGDDKLNQILQWPNDYETFNDLVANSGISKRATGNRFLKGTILDLGNNKGKVQEIHLLPAQHISITGSGMFPAKALEYNMQLGEMVKFTPEEILHDKLYNPLYDFAGHSLYGMAPLKAAVRNLTRNRSAKIASVKSFDNLGPQNILFTKDTRLTSDQAEAQLRAVKNKLDTEYTGTWNINKTVASAYEMGAISLGLSPADLKLIEAEKWDAVMLANVFNFPHLLLMGDHATMNNAREAEKALTTRCALPYLISFRNTFNKKLRTDWGYKGSNIYVDFDLSVYSELQADMGQLTDWALKSWWIPARMKYDIQQLDIPDYLASEPMLDRILVPSGLQEIGNLNPEMLDNEMDNIDNELEDV